MSIKPPESQQHYWYLVQKQFSEKNSFSKARWKWILMVRRALLNKSDPGRASL
ncbi:hypothetical protein SSYIS1_01730 [Serratia symbiotica]|uniref:Uncharacterized protein n=1 Tax=Serratia symbiotica TaxID=138074 RepID=A0A455VDA0_9GAMM|nr:hypothetical protein SSYIS1_01730 [Serratia symbiotica]